MADRAALITGGSSGIGLAIARALGEDGYSLTVSGRRPEKLEAAKAKAREHARRQHALVTARKERARVAAQKAVHA